MMDDKAERSADSSLPALFRWQLAVAVTVEHGGGGGSLVVVFGGGRW